MATTVDAVAAYLPGHSVPIESLGERLGLSDTDIKMYRRYFGLSHVVREPGATHAELLLGAAGKLDALRGREQLVRYVIYARALPAAFPYPINPAELVRSALGLDRAIVFSVTQHACAMSVLAVELAGRLLAADTEPEALALVLTGEPAVSPAVELTPGTTIMGEGTAAILVRDAPDDSTAVTGDPLLGAASHTYGEFNCGLTISNDVAARYLDAYPDALERCVSAALRQAALTLDDVDLILPHNVNRVSWVRYCKQVGIPVSRVFLDNVPVTGHCFGADPFLNYVRARELGVLRPGMRYVMVSVGRGSTFGAMVLEHR